MLVKLGWFCWPNGFVWVTLSIILSIAVDIGLVVLAIYIAVSHRYPKRKKPGMIAIVVVILILKILFWG